MYTGPRTPVEDSGRVTQPPNYSPSSRGGMRGGTMGRVASMAKEGIPITTYTSAQVRKTAFQPATPGKWPRINANVVVETAAPRLPHMLPQPSTSPTLRPPTSRQNAQIDGKPMSLATEKMHS